MTGEGSDQPRTYPAGVTSWIDTEQPDVEAALKFYGGLFGWTFEDAMPPEAPGRYVIAKLAGRDVAAIGSTDPTAPDQQVAWNTYVATDDVDATTARLRELGATVLLEPVDAGPGGRLAAFAGPRRGRVQVVAGAPPLGCPTDECARQLELQ
jgi:predicted enzyme related to lactoylglutathione lyase